MTSPIAQRQNGRYALNLLAAQRALYREVRVLRRLRTSIVVAGAAAGCLVALVLAPDPVAVGVVTGIGLLLVSLTTGGRERRRQGAAVAVQEEFDTYVYGLPWNPLLADRPSTELIAAYAGRHRSRHGDAGLTDWYSVPDGVDRWTAVLLCQRTNVSWDAPLHRRWTVLLGIGLAVPTAAVLTVAVLGLLSPAELTAAVLAPLLAPVHALIESLRGNAEHARRGARLDAEIARLLRDGAGPHDYRQIQNQIFALREAGPLVPDLLYRLRRPSLHRIVQGQNDHLTTRAEGNLS
ncbi:S-4TM family putative pore-forming effector [Micromonospora sp. WMMD956]|uniref:S-4TM family putative pore-forming effector n=1 Tax=Micromonospora sp. WMMD956 TaxID=3016108 RepID=UPI00241751B5|nr:S-4TM family putative pore-forming effector [Micromonospora sp. WMMD956]MDG4813937.1 S-4TM family putative pore-forming effector [Micromonospora sp. WMMD956]MDG4813954.1 S-4TM family putative pore-forming effector [Micromonospora sp. WMMD956]MDG4820254.1 S-4TM family putative pore-forming effector [Micromonospora sp. WMMD956]